MDSSVSPKDEIWFLRVCHHISNALYPFITRYYYEVGSQQHAPAVLPQEETRYPLYRPPGGSGSRSGSHKKSHHHRCSNPGYFSPQLVAICIKAGIVPRFVALLMSKLWNS